MRIHIPINGDGEERIQSLPDFQVANKKSLFMDVFTV